MMTTITELNPVQNANYASIKMESLNSYTPKPIRRRSSQKRASSTQQKKNLIQKRYNPSTTALTLISSSGYSSASNSDLPKYLIISKEKQTKIKQIKKYIKYIWLYIKNFSINTNDGGFRAAIFGLSDGLATNLCLIIGIQIAMLADDDTDDDYYGNSIKVYDEITRTGIAGIFGGALSMCLGEYVSMTAQGDTIKYQIEQNKILLQYQWDKKMNILKNKLKKTLKDDTIDKIINDLKYADNNNVLEFDSKIVLGINPETTGNPYKSGICSFVMFSFGGIIPLTPYFIITNSLKIATLISVVISLIFSIFLGYLIGYFTGNNLNKTKAIIRQLIATIFGVTCSIIINYVFNA